MDNGRSNNRIRPTFPVFVAEHPIAGLQAWVSQHQSQITEQLDGQGAMVIRGLDIDTPERLDEFVSLFPLENFPYNESLSNALRVNMTPRVFTANEAPPQIDIVLHHEMAQTPLAPDWLFFSCSLRAEAGGATPICRSDLVYQDLLHQRPYFLNQCEEQGLYYRQKFAFEADKDSAQGRSWPHLLELMIDEERLINQTNHDIEDLKQHAEAKLQLLGYKHQWHKNTLEVISPVLPAIRRAKNNQKVFFNQLLASYTSWNNGLNSGPSCVYFGHGQAIDIEDIKVLQEICDQHTQDIPWEVGDVAILDNSMVMHGRRAFTGKRKVYASLAIDQA